MAMLNRGRKYSVVGVDVFSPYLMEAQRRRAYAALVRADVRRLPFRARSFDVVLMMEVLEHLDKDEGLALIQDAEKIACRQVIITTPVGSHEQDEYDGNPYQKHRHIWKPAQLRALGYRIYGHGIRGLGRLSGVQSPLPFCAL
jgi:predicted SAM-dependent methyltransferase